MLKSRFKTQSRFGFAQHWEHPKILAGIRVW